MASSGLSAEFPPGIPLLFAIFFAGLLAWVLHTYISKKRMYLTALIVFDVAMLFLGYHVATEYDNSAPLVVAMLCGYATLLAAPFIRRWL